MSPLYMDTGYEPNSSGSLSAEDSHSNNAGSEREGEGQQVGKGGRKRQEKNRDAARKSRKKQTERADELHEELQDLERSNAAFQKEIASLKKDLQFYTTALERHMPVCCLQASASNLTAFLSVSPSADSQTDSSPLQASSSTQATAPSVSTSLTSRLSLQTLDSIESHRLSSLTPAPTVTSLDPASNLSAQLFTSSSSMTVPYSLPFSTVPSPLSLFCEDPPSLITSRKTKATPVCTSLISSPVLSSSLTTAAQSQSGQGTIQEGSSVSANVCFSTHHPCALDELLMKQASFPSSSSNMEPSYSSLPPENTGQAVQGCQMDMPQPDASSCSEKPSPIFPFSASAVQDPDIQLLAVANPKPSSASAFALKPSYSGHVTPNSTPLLSLLTTPSPFTASQTTSSSFEGPLSNPQLPLQSLGDSSMDFSLSELLEDNEWILQSLSSRTNN